MKRLNGRSDRFLTALQRVPDLIQLPYMDVFTRKGISILPLQRGRTKIFIESPKFDSPSTLHRNKILRKCQNLKKKKNHEFVEETQYMVSSSVHMLA